MAEPGVLILSVDEGDNFKTVTGTITQTVPVGTSLDVIVHHPTEAEFKCESIFFQAEEGVRVDVMEEHREKGRFAVRITNEGTDESAYFDPYHGDAYGGADEVQVTFERRGWVES